MQDAQASNRQAQTHLALDRALFGWIIAYELQVGRTPFQDAMSAVAITMRQAKAPFPLAGEVDPEIDSALSAWIDRIILKRIKQRTRNAMVASTELEDIITRLLGPFWRREARLPTTPPTLDTPGPLTLHRPTTLVGSGPVEHEPLIGYETFEPRNPPHEPQLGFPRARRARFGKEVNRVIR